MRLFALLGRNGIGKSIAIRAVRDELVLHRGIVLWALSIKFLEK